MGEIQEIEDPFRHIMDLFLEMKDTSELMVDLAYSSLLYNNKDIAQEVETLGDEVWDLAAELQKVAIEEASCGSSDATLMVLTLCNYVSSIAKAALSISEVVLRDIEPHPILKESIRESEVGICMSAIQSGSVLVGKQLGSIRLASETGMWVLAVRRGKKWIYGPEKGQDLKEGDLLIVRGPPNGFDRFRKLTMGKKKRKL